MQKNTSNNNGQFDPFTASQKVWLLDSQPIERDKISRSIVPDIENISSYEQYTSIFTDRFNNKKNRDEVFATLIITQNLSLDFKKSGQFDLFINATNAAIKRGFNVFIYEIRQDNETPFEKDHVVICNDIDDLIEKSRNVHLQSIVKNSDVSEEAKKIIDELKISNERKDSKIQKINEFLLYARKELDRKSSLIEQNGKRIKEYDVSLKKAFEEKKTAEDSEKDAENKVVVLQKKIDEMQIEMNKIKDENIELNTQMESDRQTIDDLTARVNILDSKTIDLQNELVSKEHIEEKLHSAMTDVDKANVIIEESKSKSDKIREQSKMISELKANLGLKDNKIKLLNDENKRVREGYKDITRVGYASEFQHFEIKQKMMYFKVINELQFYRFYIDQMLYLINKYLDRGIEFITIVVKQDFGIDEKLYPDHTLIANLGDVTNANDKYLLVPSPNMGENINEFDHLDKRVIIIDLIDNDQYYVKSSNLEEYYTIINKSKDILSLGLKGKPISYDKDTMINLEYSTKIRSMTSENQKKEYLYRLEKILKYTNIYDKN